MEPLTNAVTVLDEGGIKKSDRTLHQGMALTSLFYCIQRAVNDVVEPQRPVASLLLQGLKVQRIILRVKHQHQNSSLWRRTSYGDQMTRDDAEGRQLV